MNTLPDEIDLQTICNFGFPTFDEYRKNPDKWKKGLEEIFASVDASLQGDGRKYLVRQTYKWRDQYKCDSLEEVQRIAKNEGYTANELEICPIRFLTDGTSLTGRVEIEVQFWPKWEWKAKGKVLTNDDP